MKLFVGVTNNDWFRFLSERNPDEVNFWRPRNQNEFRALKSGDLFLFKLHTPFDFIAGGGVYVRHTFLPLPLAWQAFGEKNGVADYETFERRILEHRSREELAMQIVRVFGEHYAAVHRGTALVDCGVKTPTLFDVPPNLVRRMPSRLSMAFHQALNRSRQVTLGNPVFELDDYCCWALLVAS